MKSAFGVNAELKALLANSSQYVIYDEVEFRTGANDLGILNAWLTLTATTQDLDAHGIVQAHGKIAPTGPTARPGVGKIKVVGKNVGPPAHLLDTFTGSGNLASHTSDSGHNWVAWGTGNISQLVLNNAGLLRSGTGCTARAVGVNVTQENSHIYWDMHIGSSASGFASVNVFQFPAGGTDFGSSYLAAEVLTNTGGTGANVLCALVAVGPGPLDGVSNLVSLAGNLTQIFGSNASVMKRVDVYRIGMNLTMAFNGVNVVTLVVPDYADEMSQFTISLGAGGTNNAATIGEVDFSFT